MRERATALVLVLSCACAGKQKAHEPSAAIGSAGPPVRGAPPKTETVPQHSGKALRLFEDAVRAFDEQQKARALDFPALERKFKAVLDADDSFAEAHYDLGVLYERQKKLDEARESYRTALKKKPTLRQAAENLAVLLENEGKEGDAVAIYQEILSRSPEDGAARARLAAVSRGAGDPERALKLAREALMREPQNLLAHKVLMLTFLERDRPSMAKLVGMRATKLAENDPELRYAMGLVLAKEGDEAGSVAELRRAVKERDDHLAARVALAEVAVKHRDWAGAEEQFRKLALAEPKSAAAHVNLGVAYKGLGQVDKAMGAYEAALKADPGAREAYFNLAVLMHRHKDAPEKAVELYKKFLSVSRDNVPADHPVYEAIRECEQYARSLADTKAAEERARLEAAALKAREEQQKAAEEKTRKEEEARRKAEAKGAVDSALRIKEDDDDGPSRPTTSTPAAAVPPSEGKKGAKSPPPPAKVPPPPGKSTPLGSGSPSPSARSDEPDER